MIILNTLLAILLIANAEYCSVQNQLDIFGGNAPRLVPEGSQVTLTCCIKSRSSGQHDDQLFWNDQKNKKVPNYFEDLLFSGNMYSLVDYSRTNRLANQIVIANFSKEQEGTYTCSVPKGEKISVKLKIRPNMIIGSDLSHSAGKNSTPSLTARPIRKMMENERPNEIACIVDPAFRSEAIISWFYNGQTLDQFLLDNLGVEMQDLNQRIIFRKVNKRQKGTYLCKVDIPNPLPWKGDKDSASNHGFIIGDRLVQYQPFEIIVFSKPDILPGNPKNIHPVANKENLDPDYIVATEGHDMTLECATKGFPSPTIYWFRGANINGLVSFNKNGQVDTSKLDEKLWRLLHHNGFNSSLVQRYLGIKIAEGDRLIHEENGPILGIDHNSTIGFGRHDSPIYGLRSQQGRFAVFAGKKSTNIDQRLTVSQLTIKEVMPSDATIYTCLAVLDMEDGKAHFSVANVFPKVIFKPKFIPEGTRLKFKNYPNLSIKMTCEVFGGLLGPKGLRIFFVRGTGLLRARRYGNMEEYIKSVNDGNSDTGIEFITEDTSPDYILKTEPRTKNPYSSIATLTINNLKPEDNAYYACFAITSPYLYGVYPPFLEDLGRLTVLFKPVIADGPDIIYAIQTEPTVLSCKAKGKPDPKWEWTLPNQASKRYPQVDSIEGEYSVSNLTVPASFMTKNIFGNYICKASNNIDSDQKEQRLKLAYHPGQPRLTDCAKNSIRKIVCIEPPRDPGGFPIMYYDVRMKFNSSGSYYKMKDFPSETKSIDFSSENSEDYNYLGVSISAVTKAGKGMSASIEISKAHMEREAPRIKMIKRSMVTPTSIELEWVLENPNNTVVRLYILDCKTTSYYTDDARIKVPETKPVDHRYSYTFTNLTPNTSYKITIQADTETSFFPQSNSIVQNFTTPDIGNVGRMMFEPANSLPVAYSSKGGSTSPRATSSLLMATSLVILWGFN